MRGVQARKELTLSVLEDVSRGLSTSGRPTRRLEVLKAPRRIYRLPPLPPDPSGIRRIDVWIQSALVFSVSSAGQTFKQDFQLTQWNRKDGRHSCKDCVEKKKKEGTPYECMQCHFWKVEEAFEAESIGYRHFRRICKDCEEKSLCRGECGLHLSKSSFRDKEWVEAGKPDTNKSARHGKCTDGMDA